MIVLFLAPVTIVYLGLFIYPSVQSFYVSLFDWNGFNANMDFIGLGNFRELLTNQNFWNVAFMNSLRIFLIGGVGVFAIAFILSSVLSSDIRGKKFFRL